MVSFRFLGDAPLSHGHGPDQGPRPFPHPASTFDTALPWATAADRPQQGSTIAIAMRLRPRNGAVNDNGRVRRNFTIAQLRHEILFVANAAS